MADSVNIRGIVLDLLMDITGNDVPAHIAIGNALTKYQYLDKKDRSFISRVTKGTVERRIFLDEIIGQFSNVKIQKMKPVIRNILRMTVYQIKFMDNIPAHAACNEAVRLAKKRGFYGLSGFVNGVVRSIAANPDQIKLPDRQKDPQGYLSVVYSMPRQLVSWWLESYDFNRVEQMLASFLSEADTTIRVNTDRISVQALKTQLETAGITVKPGKYVPYALRISGYDYLSGLESFQRGCFYVQDESSMLCTEASGIRPGQLIMDVCAAPGGKSLNMALMTGPGGKVLACDKNSAKAEKILENVRRTGLEQVKVRVLDATKAEPPLFGQADVVLADVPCSGLGVIGKKADIKYHVDADSIKTLVSLQRAILTNAWQYVRPGGTLIYSTCTVNPYENESQVLWLSENFPLICESLDAYLPKALWSETTKKGWLQLLPGGGTDGFFIARLKRREE